MDESVNIAAHTPASDIRHGFSNSSRKFSNPCMQRRHTSAMLRRFEQSQDMVCARSGTHKAAAVKISMHKRYAT